MVGMPNDLFFPLDLGMYTRRVGFGCQSLLFMARSLVSFILCKGVLTKTLSTPAVFLPEFSCVAFLTERRTLE